MKELIITGDDFGLSAKTNRAIIKAWHEGVLTGASLMVGGDACAEAVSMSKDAPGLQVGLHLTLVQGRGVTPYEKFPSIVDRQQNFSSDPVHTGMRYYFIKSLRRQLLREIEAQIVAFQATGLQLSHIDGHLNIHLHPVIFDIICTLMPKYGINSCRLTREKLAPDLAINKRRITGKLAETLVFGRLSARALPRLNHLGIYFADEVKGILNSGRMTEAYLLRMLDKVCEGVTEIYFHPGCTVEASDHELSALISSGVKHRISALGIKLRNYRGDAKSYA